MITRCIFTFIINPAEVIRGSIFSPKVKNSNCPFFFFLPRKLRISKLPLHDVESENSQSARLKPLCHFRPIIKFSHYFESARHLIPTSVTCGPHKVNREIHWASMVPKCINSRERHLIVCPDSKASVATNC